MTSTSWGARRPSTAAWRWVASLVALGVLATALVLWWQRRPGDIVIGAPAADVRVAAAGPTIPDLWATSTTTSTTVLPLPRVASGGSGPVRSVAPHVLAFADGDPYGPAREFPTGVEVPDDLVFVLVVGSDARPGEDPLRARADSIHLVGVNPATSSATVVGFPRDSWVDVPGLGRSKLNAALSRGGPDLLAETVRNLTGLPVHYWMVTGFTGFTAMVDALGGVNVPVERSMADPASGAYFEAGWHHFTGGEALAYGRARKTLPGGDFDRSAHQGRIMISALAKLRSEVGDLAGLGHWLGVLVQHARVEVGAADLLHLATAARLVDPARVVNLVVPGRLGVAGGQSVVFIDPSAVELFTDLRDDATVSPSDR